MLIERHRPRQHGPLGHVLTIAGHGCREEGEGARLKEYVRRARQIDPPQGGPRLAVGPRPLCGRSAGAGRHARTPMSSARRTRMPRSCASMPQPRLAHDGVWAVITGEEIRKLSDPFLAVVKTPIQQWALAVERVRYVGEPVALVVAENRYIAEDAAELVEDRLCAARTGDRPGRGLRELGAAPASGCQDQRNLGARFPLRRSRSSLRARRPPRRR